MRLCDFSTSYPGTTPDPKHKLPFLNATALPSGPDPRRMCRWRPSGCPVWSGCVGLWELMEPSELSWDTQLWEWGKARGQAAKPGRKLPWPSGWERLPSWSGGKLGQSFFLHLHMGAVWARLFCIKVLGTVLDLEGYRVESRDSACQVWPGARLHPSETS